MPIDPDAALLAERSSFHETLLTLNDDDWNAASLCDGWRVRDVASHVSIFADLKTTTALVGILRKRGDYNAWMKSCAVDLGNRTLDRIIESAKRNAVSTRQAPGARPAQSAIDVFVHHHDVLVPLQREVPLDSERLRWMANGMVAIGRPLGWGIRVKDLRLVATDIDWHYGSGPEVSGPTAAIIMAACGRSHLHNQLEGNGVAILRQR